MEFTPGKFRLKAPPLVAVVAQVGVVNLGTFDGSRLSRLKDCLKGIDPPFPIYDQQQERNVKFVAADQPPELTEQQLHRFFVNGRSEGVSVRSNSITFFVGKTYDGFDTFRNRFSSVLDCVAGENALQFQNVGLRRVNVLPHLTDGAVPIHSSLEGFRRNGLENFTHFHHKYEFWCETPNGRLHVLCSSQHASRKPENLGQAEAVFDDASLGSYDDTVYHLDIFENCSFTEPATKADMMQQVEEMRKRTVQAFVNAVESQAFESWSPEAI